MMLKIYVPMAIDAFNRRTGIHQTEEQRANLIALVNTAAGQIETKLDQGVMSVAHVHVDNPTVLAAAQNLVALAPVVTANLGVTADGVAAMIVGAVDTSKHGAAPAVMSFTGASISPAEMPAQMPSLTIVKP
jgi:hypothetical protein